jgi:integrase
MDIPKPLPANPVRFTDRLRAFIRSKQLSYRTEKTYCYWVVDFIRFHQMARPETLGPRDIDDYLSHLAVHRSVSANTQKTALNALAFLYRQFLGMVMGNLAFVPSARPRTLPAVFSHEEAMNVLSRLAHFLFVLLFKRRLKISAKILLLCRFSMGFTCFIYRPNIALF